MYSKLVSQILEFSEVAVMIVRSKFPLAFFCWVLILKVSNLICAQGR